MLDIIAFNKLERCEDQSESNNEIFSNRLVPNDKIFNQSGGLNGYYTHSGEYITFGAGDYAKWKIMLSDMIGYPNILNLYKIVERDGTLNEILNEENINIPFVELLYFSEGVIGTSVSKKLYDDFINNHDEAIKYSKLKNNRDWLSLYEDFIKAFKISSADGCLQFSYHQLAS